MTRHLTFVLAVTALLGAALASASANAAAQPSKTNLSLELVGQVTNSAPGVTPATSIQYGYVAHMRGLPIFTAEPHSESTALFTFYVSTTTVRVINNGPLRVVSREGTMTIYSDPSANGNFVNPDSFRDGTPILVADLRQLVVVDTLTGGFSALNINTIRSSARFSAGSEVLRLGLPGATFRTILSGHLNAPVPSAYIAGYTFAVDDPAKKASSSSKKLAARKPSNTYAASLPSKTLRG